MSLEELTHLRMNHANDAKLVEQSKRVDGMKIVCTGSKDHVSAVRQQKPREMTTLLAQRRGQM
eukprot:2302237-Rhodomonas_salina.1